MPKKRAKKIVRKHYLLSLLLNVFLPWVIINNAIGDRTGDANLAYIFVLAWSVLATIVYAMYFTIPDFYKNWEKIAMYFLPSVLFSLTFFASLELWFVVAINFIFNFFCVLHYWKVIMKAPTDTSEAN